MEDAVCEQPVFYKENQEECPKVFQQPKPCELRPEIDSGEFTSSLHDQYFSSTEDYSPSDQEGVKYSGPESFEDAPQYEKYADDKAPEYAYSSEGQSYIPAGEEGEWEEYNPEDGSYRSEEEENYP